MLIWTASRVSSTSQGTDGALDDYGISDDLANCLELLVFPPLPAGNGVWMRLNRQTETIIYVAGHSPSGSLLLPAGHIIPFCSSPNATLIRIAFNPPPVHA